jgi:hypothetical protein
MGQFLYRSPNLPEYQPERCFLAVLMVRCQNKQGDQFGERCDHGHDRDHQQRDIGERIAQHM